MDERETRRVILLVISIISLCLVSIVLYLLRGKVKREKNYLTISYGCVVWLNTLFLVMILSQQSYSALCSNNANGITARDGFTTCAVQAIVTQYTITSCSISYMLQAIDLFLRVFYGCGTRKYSSYHLLFIFLWPLEPTTYIISSEIYGYGSYGQICTYNKYA